MKLRALILEYSSPVNNLAKAITFFNAHTSLSDSDFTPADEELKPVLQALKASNVTGRSVFQFASLFNKIPAS